MCIFVAEKEEALADLFKIHLFYQSLNLRKYEKATACDFFFLCTDVNSLSNKTNTRLFCMFFANN